MSADAEPIRILLADDNAGMREGISGLLALESDMAVVAEASNGREAVQQFRVHHPDITLMDLQMPELSGLQALAAIRKEFPAARIIVLTTYSDDQRASEALNCGAAASLLKGSLHKELTATIRAVHGG